MRSIIAKGGKSTLPSPAVRAHPRLDRVAAATREQMKTALIVLSDFSPDAFDYAMDAAESGEDPAINAARDKEDGPSCAICGGSVGVFLGLGLDWRHFNGDGTTAGQQRVYDPGHVPVVTWKVAQELHA